MTLDRSQTTKSQGLPERVAEGEQAEERDDAEHGGHGLAEADGAGDGGAAQNDGGQEGQLDAPGLPVLQAVSSQAVFLVGRVSYGRDFSVLEQKKKGWGGGAGSGGGGPKTGKTRGSEGPCTMAGDHLHKIPTVRPAATEGTEPVLR